MEAVRKRLLQDSQRSSKLVIPITFGDYSPIELDPGASLTASIAARMLFAVHCSHHPPRTDRTLNEQFAYFLRQAEPLLRCSSNPIDAARSAIFKYPSKAMPIILLIDMFPRAYKIWSEVACSTILGHETMPKDEVQMVFFGFSSWELSSGYNKLGKKVKAVAETLDSDCFGEMDKRIAALEALVQSHPNLTPTPTEDGCEKEEPETTEEDTETNESEEDD